MFINISKNLNISHNIFYESKSSAHSDDTRIISAEVDFSVLLLCAHMYL